MSDKRFPLSWPAGWPRSSRRTRAAFGKTDRQGFKEAATVADGIRRLQTELDRLGASQPILSTNVELRLDGLPRSDRGQPADPGVAVYFKLKGQDVALACDRWDRVADNLIALAKHIEAIRGMDRWGVGRIEQAFRGYEALPAPEQWWQVLGFGSSSMITRADVEAAYRRLALQAHPDRGGTDAAMARLNAARDAGLAATS